MKKTTHDSEDHYRGLIENLFNCFIYRHDTSGKFNYVSPSVSKVLGYSQEEFLRHFTTYHTDHPANDHVSKATQLSMQGIQQPPYEVQIFHKNGKKCWLEVAESPIFDEGGVVVAVEGIAHDITGRKNTEDELERIFNMTGYMICVANLDGYFIKVNDSFEHTLGYSSEELLSKPFFDFVHPDDVEKTIAAVEKDLARGAKVIDFENRYRCKDGSYRWLSWASSPMTEKGVTYAIAYDVTERKQAELDLLIAHERLDLAIEAANMGLWDWDIRTGKVIRSDRVLEMLGYTPEEMAGIEGGFGNLIHPDDRQGESLAVLKHVDNKTASYEAEYRVRTKSGEYRWIFAQGKAIERDGDGKALRIVGTNLDITERKEAEEKLRIAHERLELALKGADLGMWDWDRATNQVIRSDSLVEMLGYSQDEIAQLEGGFRSLFHLGDHEHSVEAWDAHLRGKAPLFESEYRVRCKSGQYKWILSRGKALEFDSQNTATRVVGTNLDITEWKEAEEKLQIAHERLELALKGADLGMWDWDLTTNIVIRNDRLIEMLGYTQDEIKYREGGYASLIHHDDVGISTIEWEKHVNGKTPFYECEYRVICKSGQYKWILSRGKAVERDVNGTALRITGTNLDITERKQAQTQREALIGQLESQNAEMERFVYTVSHDLKAPLITIRGYLGMLPDDIRQDRQEQVDDDIARIFRATDRMKDLLQDLLELSRIGRVDKQREEIDLTALAYQALELVVNNTVENAIDIKIEPDMPTVIAERVHMLEVFQNLIGNAIKFTQDSPEPKIKIGYQRNPGNIVYFVKDNGVVIDPKYFEKVFELFQKLTPAQEGTGIGLAIVKRVIEVHNGNIWVESEGKDKGSTFCFTLPQPENVS